MFQAPTRHYIQQEKEMISMKPIKTTQTSILTPNHSVPFNTLRMGYADLRFYITTVQDG